MKILEIIPQLSQGGAERFVVDLCNELVKKHKVELIVLHSIDKHGFFEKELDDRVQIICMNKNMGIDWKLFFRIAKLIHREQPDVVHTHLDAILYLIFPHFFFSKIKFIHTLHSDAYKEHNGFLSELYRRIMFGLRCVHPITISEESQRSFKNLYHLPSTLIYNGRPAYIETTDIPIIKKELSDLKVNVKSKMIVNVARIDKAKNQIALAKAIDSLNRKNFAIELAIIGNMADKEIVHEIRSLDSPYVHLLGLRNNPRDYMKAADAFCLTSVYEGMPITLIECFSVGAIPLCTPVGGIMNMITDGQNGLLSNSPSQKDIEEMLLRFLALDEKEVYTMRQNSKNSFRSFDMATCAERYLQIISNL